MSAIVSFGVEFATALSERVFAGMPELPKLKGMSEPVEVFKVIENSDDEFEGEVKTEEGLLDGLLDGLQDDYVIV